MKKVWAQQNRRTIFNFPNEVRVESKVAVILDTQKLLHFNLHAQVQ